MRHIGIEGVAEMQRAFCQRAPRDSFGGWSFQSGPADGYP